MKNIHKQKIIQEYDDLGNCIHVKSEGYEEFNKYNGRNLVYSKRIKDTFRDSKQRKKVQVIHEKKISYVNDQPIIETGTYEDEVEYTISQSNNGNGAINKSNN